MSQSISYPHPVLGNGEDIKGSFSVNISITKKDGGETITFAINPKIENQYFQGLLDQGKAAIATKVYCASTLYSQTHQNAKKFELHQDDVDGTVTISSYIVSTTDIPNYKDDSFNPNLFDDIAFEVTNGDIIGALSEQNVELSKVDEKTGLGNIFEFDPREMDEPISFFVEGDLIRVTYPKNFEGDSPLNALFKQSPWVAVHIYIMPALIFALQSVKGRYEEFEDSNYRWYKTIKGIIGDDAIREPEPTKHAQEILLRDGLQPSLQAYKETTTRDKNGN